MMGVAVDAVVAEVMAIKNWLLLRYFVFYIKNDDEKMVMRCNKKK